jgi:hypothetical protein
MVEAGRLLQWLEASESRREQAESRFPTTLLQWLVALAAVEGANEGMGSWRPPPRMVAADLVSLVAATSSSGLAGSTRARGGAGSSSGLAGSTTRESDEERPDATRKWEVRGCVARQVRGGAGWRGTARRGEAGGARLGGVASFSFASAPLKKGSFWFVTFLYGRPKSVNASPV